MSFFIDRCEQSICDVVDKGLEHKVFEYLKSLISEWSQRIDFYIESVQVLKESLHPSDHDTVVDPLNMKFLEELISASTLLLEGHLL